MKTLANILWLILGGLEAAIGYFTGALALCVTIIGIPWGLQVFKIGLLCLWPFGATVQDTEGLHGCIRVPMNVVWFIFGGAWAWLCHIFFGLLLCLIVVGIPWGKQHFKMARLSLAPFGKEVTLGL